MYNSISNLIGCIETLERLAVGRLSRIESVISDSGRTDEEKIKVINRLLNETLFNTEDLMSDSKLHIRELRTTIEVLHEKGCL